jgi:hypothetical protein
VRCQRTADDHYRCRAGNLTLSVERSKATGRWVESRTRTDLHDYLVELLYGPPGCNAPDC